MHPVRLHPRLHRIFPEGISNEVYLLREDEAGFAVAGGKRRKYAALVPWLQEQGYAQVAVIGSLHSNNVLAASQFLLEAGLRPVLFLKEAHFEGPGNAFLTELLVPRSEWHLVPSPDWPNVNELAAEFAAAAETPTYVLPEGAFCEPAFWGTTGLAEDLRELTVRHEMEVERVYMDAGTGLSAAGLIWGGEWPVRVIGMALSAEEFEAVVVRTGSWYAPGQKVPVYDFQRPRNARSFGAVNQTVLRDLVAFARTHGVLTDPIYSGKLLREAFQDLRESPAKGPVVLVHSGGASTLAGFYDRLRPLL